MPKSRYSDRYKQFQALLIEARKKAGLTQTELAKKLSRPQSFVAKFEGGERRLDVIEFIEVSDTLGCDPLRLIKKLRP